MDRPPERQEARARRAEAEVERLTAERDAAIERLERVIDQWRETGRAVISEMNRADKAEAERDALAAAHARESEKVRKVEEVMDDIEGSDPTTWALRRPRHDGGGPVSTTKWRKGRALICRTAAASSARAGACVP